MKLSPQVATQAVRKGKKLTRFKTVQEFLDEAEKASTLPIDLDPRIDFTKPVFEQAEALRAQDDAEFRADAIFESLKPKLIDNDDPDLWQAVLQAVVFDIEAGGLQRKVKDQLFIQIGSCCHWFRPH
jgi:hypothetical protein